MNTYLARNCPGCGSSRISDAKTITAKTKAEDLCLEELSSAWNGKRGQEKTFFSYQRCADCGLLYCPVFFTPAQLQLLYSNMPANMADVPASNLEKTQAGYLAIIGKRSRLCGSYLEIGPDKGFLVKQISRTGHFQNYWLFEPNTSVHPELRAAVTGNATCHIREEMFSLAITPDESIDLAVLVHVLDHVLDPQEILSQVRRKLKKDSTLAIVVHDETSLMAKILGPRWLPYCIYHPELYSPSSIRSLLEKNGFEKVQVRKTTNVFPVNYLLRHLVSALGVRNPSWGSFLSKLPLGNISLKLGNMMALCSPRT